MPRRACCRQFSRAADLQYDKILPMPRRASTMAITSNAMPLSQVEDLVDTRVGTQDFAAHRGRLR